MRFLIDRCAGGRLAKWLHDNGHDVLEAWTLGPDPGDQALLELAASQNRILITLDTDFGELIYMRGVRHAGLIRLPDVPAGRRIALVSVVISRYRDALKDGAIVTVRGGRIRISRYPPGVS